MSTLPPDLKRLFKWAQQASPPAPAEAPFGFASRVWANRQPAKSPTLFEELQRTTGAFCIVALIFIVGGTLVLLNHHATPPVPQEFSSALHYLACNFHP
jgi:hypothetical protein